jgi:protein TonB
MKSNNVFLNDWGNEVSTGRNDIVFETRNRQYGAYDLRRFYGKRASVSFGITLGIVFFVLAIPLIIKLLSPSEDTNAKHRTKEVVTELGPPPPLEKELPPPPKLNIPKQVEQVRFVPPKVVIKPVDEPELPKNTEPPKPPPPPDATPGPDTTVYAAPSAPIPPPKKPEVYSYVEQMPSFPGGEEKLFQYLNDNMKYPSMARETNIQGKVFVNFVVDEEGKISNVKVLRGIGAGCDEEAVRVVKAMPNWKPGKQNGRAVPVSYNLPIQFKLQ